MFACPALGPNGCLGVKQIPGALLWARGVWELALRADDRILLALLPGPTGGGSSSLSQQMLLRCPWVKHLLTTGWWLNHWQPPRNKRLRNRVNYKCRSRSSAAESIAAESMCDLDACRLNDEGMWREGKLVVNAHHQSQQVLRGCEQNGASSHSGAVSKVCRSDPVVTAAADWWYEHGSKSLWWSDVCSGQTVKSMPFFFSHLVSTEV